MVPGRSLPKPPIEREADFTARVVWQQYFVAVGCHNNEPRVHSAKIVAHSRQGADNRQPSLSPAAHGGGHSKSLAADCFLGWSIALMSHSDAPEVSLAYFTQVFCISSLHHSLPSVRRPTLSLLNVLLLDWLWKTGIKYRLVQGPFENQQSLLYFKSANKIAPL